MQYQGGKARTAAKFAPILDQELLGGRTLVEPFVGGFNIIPRLTPGSGAGNDFLCSDRNAALIAMYQALQDGWDPPSVVTREEYDSLRARADAANPMTAFAAFGCSYSGKEWGGYAADAHGRNYAAQARAALLLKSAYMTRVRFSVGNYWETVVPTGSVVYCDPPYLGTTGYRGGAFDHERFYAWCESLVVVSGCVVLVSEFTVPAHWVVVWESPRVVTAGRIHPVRELLARVIPRSTGE